MSANTHVILTSKEEKIIRFLGTPDDVYDYRSEKAIARGTGLTIEEVQEILNNLVPTFVYEFSADNNKPYYGLAENE